MPGVSGRNEYFDPRSAELGQASTFDKYQPSNKMSHLRDKTLDSVADKEGHSDESSEGVVANHDPFNGI